MTAPFFFDILPFYLLLGLLPLTGLVVGAIIAPLLYATRRRLALLLNIAGLATFVWVGYLVFLVTILDFNLDSQAPFHWLVTLALALLCATLFFGAVEWLTFSVMRRLQTKQNPSDKRALDYFHQGYSCAQSVAAPFAAELGLTEEQALKLAAGFGAGIGRMRETCGAFCGLTFVAGHCRGNLHGDTAEKERIFALVRDEADHFRAEFGTLSCRELLHLEEGTQEGARPNERTAAYYAARPCERCVAFCEARARKLLQEHASELQ